MRQISSADVSTGGEFGRGRLGAPHEIVARGAAHRHDGLERRRGRLRLLELVEEAVIAQSERHLGLAAHEGELLGPQERHRGDGDAAGLHHREEGGGHQRVVRRAQQHPPSRHEAVIGREHIGDAVHERGEFRVAVALVERAEAGRGAMALAEPGIHELGDAIQALRIAQLRQGEDEVRQLVRRRQMVARERVEMGAVALHHGHIAHPPLARLALEASSARAMTIFCTSLAPS